MAMFDFLSNPDVLQAMGNAGAALSRDPRNPGRSMGEVLNPAEVIRNIQNQKATRQLLGMLTQPTTQPQHQPQVSSEGGVPLDPNGMTMMPPSQLQQLTVPNKSGATKHTVSMNPDGSLGYTTTGRLGDAPMADAYGSNVAPESIKTPTVPTVPTTSQLTPQGSQVPFWQALLG